MAEERRKRGDGGSTHLSFVEVRHKYAESALRNPFGMALDLIRDPPPLLYHNDCGCTNWAGDEGRKRERVQLLQPTICTTHGWGKRKEKAPHPHRDWMDCCDCLEKSFRSFSSLPRGTRVPLH